MEIKVIDLLNIIAEDKELPEKFMYKGHLYYRQKTKGICYRCDELNEIFEECLVLEDLNDTVEIIEEPKKIEHCLKRDRFLCDEDEIEHFRTKIDELIDEINNLKEE